MKLGLVINSVKRSYIYLVCSCVYNYESDFNHIPFSHSTVMDPRETGRIAYNLALKQKEMVDLETSKLQNSDERCWGKCEAKDGPCEWCGTEGWCCRQKNIKNGCDGNLGSKNHHICVHGLGFEPLKLVNPGEKCWKSCKGQGPCNWCGSEGWCCRKGWIGNGCDGSFGGDNDHTCVLSPGNLEIS